MFFFGPKISVSGRIEKKKLTNKKEESASWLFDMHSFRRNFATLNVFVVYTQLTGYEQKIFYRSLYTGKLFRIPKICSFSLFIKKNFILVNCRDPRFQCS